MICFLFYIIYVYLFSVNNYDKKYIGKNLKKISFKLGTLGIKIGQVFSNRIDILDKEICESLNDLRDKVPGLKKKDNDKLIQEIKNKIPIKHIDENPIGAGCIAIVYKATLKNDENVVIKVKRPNIEDELNQSMIKVERLLYYLSCICVFRSMELDQRLIELKELIYNQVNFENELSETVYFYKKFKKHKFIKTPKPYQEYSNESMLVLEYINGIKIDDLDDGTKEKISLPLTGLLISSMFIDGHYHGDLHTGNMMYADNKLCIYDFGLVCRFKNEDDKNIAYDYYMSLMNKKWDVAINILLNRMCETKISDEDSFKINMNEILIKHFELNDKWDPVSYIRDVSKCIKDHGSIMSKSFVNWELSMITVQGAITQICKKNIWELCREINDVYSLE